MKPRPAGSSSGFEGAERMDLLKNVHVVIRDVGKSGILPGSAKTPRMASAMADARAEHKLGGWKDKWNAAFGEADAAGSEV